MKSDWLHNAANPVRRTWDKRPQLSRQTIRSCQLVYPAAYRFNIPVASSYAPCNFITYYGFLHLDLRIEITYLWGYQTMYFLGTYLTFRFSLQDQIFICMYSTPNLSRFTKDNSIFYLDNYRENQMRKL